MHNTLLMRLMAPMQSWGVESRFAVRDTGREPSKSGVVGLLCAALGRPRTQPVDDLASLRMGVRVDREGRLQMDYHTARDVYRAGGGRPKETEVSRRYYLADAIFLVGLETRERALLEHLHNALISPTWPLYLGRKAFIPSLPIWLPDGVKAGISLEQALEQYPFLGRGDVPGRLRLLIDDPRGEIVRMDRPVSFVERRFAPRRVRAQWITLGGAHEAT